MELTLNRLTKKYGTNVAVDQIQATFSPGVYGLLGANGAGKTTLMRMICDVLSPTDGEILLNGKNINTLRENYRKVLGYLPQNFGYYPDYTAQEFMYYIAVLKGLPRMQAKKQTRQLLEIVSLTSVANKKIKTFSGGMKQRLGIAQAVLGSPRILILDEPTAGLDPKERVRFRNLISDFARNKIVILSTHIVSDVEYIADHILLMKHGRLIMSKPAKDSAREMDGKVWECSISQEKIDEWSSRYCIANLHHTDNNRILVRLISEHRPSPNAVPAEPTLEDLYLYHFQNNHA
ncbi:ABC transporter ATP-binding protein [Roseburia hominis]